MLNERVGVQFNLPSSTYECRGTSVVSSIWSRDICLRISSISVSGILAEEITSFIIAKSSSWRHWVRSVDKHESSLQCPVCCTWPTVTVSSGSLAAAVGLMNERSDVLETLGQFLCYIQAVERSWWVCFCYHTIGLWISTRAFSYFCQVTAVHKEPYFS